MTLASRLRRCGTLALTVLLLLTTAAESGAQSQNESQDDSSSESSPTAPVTQTRPHLAVLPVATAAGVPPGAGPTLAGLLVAGIDTQRYALVERARAAQLLEETRLQDTDLVDPATRAAELGRLAGLRYLVLGEVSDLGPLRWTARVIDCETGAIGARGSVRFENYHAADAAAAQLLAQLGLSVPGAATPSTAPVGHALMDARNPDPAVSLSLTTGEGRTDYLDGENISFRVRASADGYVTLVTLDAAGDLTLLLPNRWQPRAVVHAGEPITLPAPGAGFRFPAQAPHGRTVVKAVFTTRPLMLRGVDPVRIESEGFIAGGNLNDGEKAIGLAGEPDADPDLTAEPAAAPSAPAAPPRNPAPTLTPTRVFPALPPTNGPPPNWCSTPATRAPPRPRPLPPRRDRPVPPTRSPCDPTPCLTPARRPSPTRRPKPRPTPAARSTTRGGGSWGPARPRPSSPHASGRPWATRGSSCVARGPTPSRSPAPRRTSPPSNTCPRRTSRPSVKPRSKPSCGRSAPMIPASSPRSRTTG